MWLLSNDEILAVTQLKAADRVKYAIKKIADEDKLWGLWLNGWCVYRASAGSECLGVWPHRSYAELCTSGEFFGAVPREISLPDWLDSWIPGMIKDGREVTIFPTDKDLGCVVNPERMDRLLREELDNL